MSNIDEKIQYFLDKHEEIKKKQMELQMLAGQFDKEFGAWLKESGMPDQFSPIHLIKHFRNT
jgi:hypothetical protein